ncbi:hypothetical protein PHAVU_009G036500 [Phaseolus vulgaris]|uniref:NAB domain-containing protein n=1 Tax=Phaseolus vulgaris TaxID=3885 RepID=V7ARY4_PHAVU|nr:hypothetical protein PHAVU_009G036500g [Phaseolus vulgaris]ESW08324.1 hypothetical protein PHAVU_009G036500g [Phaseolus vulgaris]
MLQRAATNAYSWWWASHIRTKQSKWLEQSLQDMEDVVAETLKIIHNEGESFSQRAEMYYRKRPQLIGYVEEVFRAYRALAERYDHISKELQSANRTIASVFPQQVHYRIDEDDGEESFPGTKSSSQDPNNQTRKEGIPKAPNIPKHFRSRSMLFSPKGPARRIVSSAKSPPISPSSGLRKAEALAEVDKLQKEILSLQTEKEFVRSLHEHSYEKYWEIEDKITEMQKSVCSLEDEFGINNIIEDNDARALMEATALNSCKETLAKLQEVKAQSSEEAEESYQMVKEDQGKLKILRDWFDSKHTSQGDQGAEPKSMEEEEVSSLEKEMHECEVELLQDTIIEQLDLASGKINDVEPDEEGENLQLHKNRSAPDDELKEESEKPGDDTETMKDLKTTEEENEDYSVNLGDVRNEDNKYNLKKSIDLMTGDNPELIPLNNDDLSEPKSNLDTESLDQATGEKDQANWSQMFASGLDDREKILSEFNSVLKNYEDVKGKLNDVEKKNRDSIFELSLQVRELKDTVETKEKEINILQQKLTCSETNSEESPRTTLPDYNYTSQEALIGSAPHETDTEDTEHPSSNTDAGAGAGAVSNSEESPRTTLPDYNYTSQEALLGSAPHETDTEDTEHPSSNTDAGAGAVSTSDADQHQQYIDKKTRIGILVKVTSSQHNRRHSLSILEKKFRSAIDRLLEENLEFWLMFSTSVHQTQKFQNSIQDLKCDLKHIREINISQENSNIIQSEIKPIIKHLREIRTELLLWLEHNEMLHEELQSRHPSLCTFQDEIARAANPNCESNMADLSGYQAAKFQGEVLNMKQENNKVCSQLHAGVVFVKGLKGEVEKMLQELSQEMGVNNHDQITKQSTNRPRIPLKSFLFGVKIKKQRQPVNACESPTEQRQYSDLASCN